MGELIVEIAKVTESFINVALMSPCCGAYCLSEQRSASGEVLREFKCYRCQSPCYRRSPIKSSSFTMASCGGELEWNRSSELIVESWLEGASRLEALEAMIHRGELFYLAEKLLAPRHNEAKGSNFYYAFDGVEWRSLKDFHQVLARGDIAL